MYVHIYMYECGVYMCMRARSNRRETAGGYTPADV